MIRSIHPRPLQGAVCAMPSKSMAHRLLICQALAGEPLSVAAASADLTATSACLQALQTPNPVLPCGESGSTLRFLLPVAAALGIEAEFVMEGRLPERPLFPLDRELERHGITLTRPQPHILRCEGRLCPGHYTVPGDISSQFVSGLLFALPLLDAPCTLTVTGRMESEPYIRMTLSALRQFGVEISQAQQTFSVKPQPYRSPGIVSVEGDWSNAAFWLCAGALGGPVTVTGLNPQSLQGDRAVLDVLRRFGAQVQVHGDAVTVSRGCLRPVDIDAADIPDLVPVLSVLAAAAPGITTITNAARLRLKESDRLAAVCGLLQTLGGSVRQTGDGLIISGGIPLTGGTVDCCGDHRMVMAAAVAAALCRDPVRIPNAEAVAKSDPGFWDAFDCL